MRCIRRASSHASSVPAGASWYACPAAATRTWTPSMKTETSGLEGALRASGDLKLVGYMMAGHPNKKRSLEVGKRLAGSGIAALEIGIPFSDPLADGPVIQHAGQVALEHGMNVAGAVPGAPALAAAGGPVVPVTHTHPALAHHPPRAAPPAPP